MRSRGTLLLAELFSSVQEIPVDQVSHFPDAGHILRISRIEEYLCYILLAGPFLLLFLRGPPSGLSVRAGGPEGRAGPLPEARNIRR